jgi:uncharacterized membrane protein YoaK (UPF0700 family)
MRGPGGQVDWVAFLMACAMAFLAGATDICGLSALHDLFVSFMSGNTTMLAFALGHGQFTRASMVAELIGLFMGGAFVGTIIAVISGRWHLSIVTLTVAIMLSMASVWTAATVPILTLAMGILNAAMHRADATGVSLTYVTGVLVKFAQGLGHAVCGQPSDPSWPLQGILWLALFAGAIISTLALLSWPIADLLFALSLLASLLAVVGAFRSARNKVT